ncbi:MAG: hypothetical protein EZS28_055278, partial [Streblomastix strix]
QPYDQQDYEFEYEQGENEMLSLMKNIKAEDVIAPSTKQKQSYADQFIRNQQQNIIRSFPSEEENPAITQQNAAYMMKLINKSVECPIHYDEDMNEVFLLPDGKILRTVSEVSSICKVCFDPFKNANSNALSHNNENNLNQLNLQLAQEEEERNKLNMNEIGKGKYSTLGRRRSEFNKIIHIGAKQFRESEMEKQ